MFDTEAPWYVTVVGAGMGLASAVWLTWCTVIAFVGGQLPLTSIEVDGGLGFGLLWLFVFDPIAATVGVLGLDTRHDALRRHRRLAGQPVRTSNAHRAIGGTACGRRLLLILLVVTVAVACGSGDDSNAGGNPSPEESAIGAKGSLSAHDLDIIAGLEEHSGAWNETAAPFVRDYMDAAVDAETWVTGAGPQLNKMRGIVARLDADVLSISDAGVRSVFAEVVDNYKAKVAAATGLVNAVAAGDPDAEEAAGSDLSASAEAGRRLAEGILDRLRPFVDPDELSRRLRQKGADVEKLLVGG